jgi:protein gp37
MNRTKIEWVRNSDGSQGYTINPVKGYCPVGCPYCYARRMYDRFKWDKTIRFDMTAMDGCYLLPSHSKIFVGSTIELFGDWVQPWWMQYILDCCANWQHYTFIFLTKQPQNLQKWSPFPQNCYIGVSVTNYSQFHHALDGLQGISARVKFISFEPLQEGFSVTRVVTTKRFDICFGLQDLDWLIIGAETGNRKGKPPLSQVQNWAREIIKVADEAGIPCFTKDNLKLPANEVRREFPNG